MLTFLFITAIALTVAGFGVVALPILAIGALLWLVMLPLKLLLGFVFGGLFRLVFGVLGALLGLILGPILLLVVGIALLGAFFAAALALIAPLIPVILLLLLGWGIYRVARPNAAAW